MGDTSGSGLRAHRPEEPVEADSLAILTHHWHTIERLAAGRPDGPWMYAVTQSGLQLIDLG